MGLGNLQQAIFNELLTESRGQTTVHSQLGTPWTQRSSRIAAPPPREVLRLLQTAGGQGTSIADILDTVSMSRVARSVRDSSFSCYMSHLKCICAVCELLQEAVVPCELRTIRRYTAVCNNPVTLRGHLAAWRLLHLVFGHEWPGDRDPFIRAAHAGLLRSAPPRKPKLSIRMGLTLRIAEHCFNSPSPAHGLFGIMVSLSYLFALRVPSELLRQGSIRMIKVTPEVCYYGPVHRKGCTDPVVLQRRCLCNTHFRFLCPHSWYGALQGMVLPDGKPFSSWICSSFNQFMRETLLKIGLDSGAVAAHCSRDFRRGCAKDMLAHAGPAAMLAHCGWRNSRSAIHYVSQDEIAKSVVALMLAEYSDEEGT